MRKCGAHIKDWKYLPLDWKKSVMNGRKSSTQKSSQLQIVKIQAANKGRQQLRRCSQAGEKTTYTHPSNNRQLYNCVSKFLI